MTDWLGQGTTITVVSPTVSTACTEYLTVDEVRAEYGDEVADVTDATLQRRIDGLVSLLESQLGHTFGRAAIVRSSSATDTVQVGATGVVIGGHTFLFANYATLGLLAAAINAAGHAFSIELLPQIDPSTPSDLLAVQGATACGAGAENRAILCLSALWVRVSGAYESHLFLPLPLQTVNEVTEDGTILAATAYWAVAGETWLVRKLCSCSLSTTCAHPTGHWAATYPGNIYVEYTPLWWQHPPASLKEALLEAFGAKSNIGGLEAESFGGAYSYRRGQADKRAWQDMLDGAGVRQYGVRFHP